MIFKLSLALGYVIIYTIITLKVSIKLSQTTLSQLKSKYMICVLIQTHDLKWLTLFIQMEIIYFVYGTMFLFSSAYRDLHNSTKYITKTSILDILIWKMLHIVCLRQFSLKSCLLKDVLKFIPHALSFNLLQYCNNRKKSSTFCPQGSMKPAMTIHAKWHLQK